jgi:hypothetical protein
MTVAELEGTMSNGEYVHWSSFFRLRAQQEEQAMNKAKRKK